MGFYSIASIRASVNALAEIGKSVKVIDDYDHKGCAIEFPHVHTSVIAGLDPITIGTTEIWRKALSEMEYQRKMIGPCSCGSSPITIDDVRCFRDEWHELIAEIKTANGILEAPAQLQESPALRFYSCTRARTDECQSMGYHNGVEKHGQWHVKPIPELEQFDGHWIIEKIMSNRTILGEFIGTPKQVICIRERSAQAAAEKAETILTAISRCF